MPEPDKSVGDCPDDDNLIIHGDNLHALKALLPRYAGRVKCIYIDPPYNTGNEGWSYNDNANGPILKQWLAEEAPVDTEDLERHDKWLCMMWPRLQLLKELLSEDGVIFVSIDDNEQHHLRMLMDGIFGESNFISTIIWHKMDSPKNTAIHISEDHESLHVYAKNARIWRPNKLARSEKMLKRYKNPDNDPRGPWLLSDLAARNPYSRGRYPITTPAGNVIEGPPAGSSWRISKEKFQELDADNRIWWGKQGRSRPGIKRFLSEVQEGVVPQSLWRWEDVGSTRHSKQELSNIMAAPTSSDLFVTPKPSRLIRQIVQMASDADSIVLDSFAGSGTTAHAVLAMNNQDGGNRRFILVECEDYADGMTAERVRRVISGVPDSRDTDLCGGLAGSFTYCTLGDPVTASGMLDGGTLPTFSSLAAWLMHTATGRSVGPSELRPLDEHGLIYSDLRRNYYLRYKPDLDWLSSNEAVLTEAR
ncbi:MAG: site-specific DNA-methyltransferase, partial [Acidimicrobiaceae bacterium]|nr:site-specific DNA-methyltransferase [Acidimicrobiaceae bacterium]